MIAACPTCGARYRIDVSKLRPEGARLRCARCEAVFRVRPPAEAEAPRAAASPVSPPAMVFDDAPPPQPVPTPASPRAPAPLPPRQRVQAEPPPPPVPTPTRETPPDRERLVLVAHPEVAAGKALVAALAGWGLETLLVHDGVEAILNVQRALPKLVVLDAALPKMFGFQVCELMKRNESLRGIHVVLVGAIHDQARYRRPPGDLYGADAYVERHELPGALEPLLEQFGLLERGAEAPAAPSRAPLPPPPPRAAAPERARPAPQAVPERARPAPQTAPREQATRAPAGPQGEARAQAERLARIIVSDIVLYNADKFEAGVRSGDVISALDNELEEGRALFAARIDPRVGPADEFLQRELLRVAKSRGMAG